MPLTPHTVFEEPGDDELLWRYMDLPRFLSLLTSQTLWFSNQERLADDDPFEGTLPSAEFAHRSWNVPADMPENERRKLATTHYTGAGSDEISKLEALKVGRDYQIEQTFAYRKTMFINCWHRSPIESAAMWSIYSKTGEGIAITTTKSRLVRALSEESRDVNFGKVRYLDYDIDTIDQSNMFAITLAKRNSFAHEKEVRLVFWDTSITHRSGTLLEASARYGVQPHPGMGPNTPVSWGLNPPEIFAQEVPVGLPIRCDLGALIDGIWLAPKTAEWFKETVSAIVRAFGLQHTLAHSSLSMAPPR